MNNESELGIMTKEEKKIVDFRLSIRKKRFIQVLIAKNVSIIQRSPFPTSNLSKGFSEKMKVYNA